MSAAQAVRIPGKVVAISPEPSEDVLKAFGLTGLASALSGGMETAFVVDGVVLKPSEEALQAFLGERLSAITRDGFRLARVLKPSTGHVRDGVRAPLSLASPRSRSRRLRSSSSLKQGADSTLLHSTSLAQHRIGINAPTRGSVPMPRRGASTRWTRFHLCEGWQPR